MFHVSSSSVNVIVCSINWIVFKTHASHPSKSFTLFDCVWAIKWKWTFSPILFASHFHFFSRKWTTTIIYFLSFSLICLLAFSFLSESENFKENSSFLRPWMLSTNMWMYTECWLLFFTFFRMKRATNNHLLDDMYDCIGFYIWIRHKWEENHWNTVWWCHGCDKLKFISHGRFLYSKLIECVYMEYPFTYFQFLE